MKRKSSVSFTKYPQESDFGGGKVLNIGCGFAKYTSKNVVNLDAHDNCKPDIKWDLAVTPLPFNDEEFDFIMANHILEHVPNWWLCFNECSRILKKGGRLEVWIPGAGSDAVHGFRDHINEINNCSFFGTYGMNRGMSNAWAEKNNSGHAKKLALKSVMSHLDDHGWLMILPKFLQKWCATHLRNVIFETGFVFEKVA